MRVCFAHTKSVICLVGTHVAFGVTGTVAHGMVVLRRELEIAPPAIDCLVVGTCCDCLREEGHGDECAGCHLSLIHI